MNPALFAPKKLWRELNHGRGQALLFVLCVALSLVSLVAINSFRRDVSGSLLNDGKALQGGDVIVESSRPFPPQLERALTGFAAVPGHRISRGMQLYTVVRNADGGEDAPNLMAAIHLVEPNYPLYGSISLTSGRDFASRIGKGRAVAAPALFKRLGLAPGDRLQVGNTTLTLSGEIEAQSKQPLNFFTFGVPLFASTTDMQAMGLSGGGSRLRYLAWLRLRDDEGAAEATALVTRLKQLPGTESMRIDTWLSAQSRVGRFFDNLLLFLSLVAIFTLLLAGIGMQSALTAFLARKRRSIAIQRALGATGRLILLRYLTLTLFLGVCGSLLGVALGLAVKKGLLQLFTAFLPASSRAALQLSGGGLAADLLWGCGIGLLVTLFFTFLPLSGLQAVKPATIFRGGTTRRFSPVQLLLQLGGLLVLAFIVYLMLGTVTQTLWFTLGVCALLVVLLVLLAALLALVHRMTRSHFFPRLPLTLRQALRGLFRPGNRTTMTAVTLAAALSLLLTIQFLGTDLAGGFVRSWPPGSPTLFCLDLQQNQRQEFEELVNGAVAEPNLQLFPIIRARLKAIRGTQIDRQAERKRRGDNLARELNLTWRDATDGGTLADNEELVTGSSVFPKTPAPDDLPPVSVMDTFAEMGQMQVGDVLEFKVQGVPLKARVSSIRHRTGSVMAPFFYFVFPRATLAAAPHTFFATIRVPRQQIAPLINRILNRFPNLTPINMSDTAERLSTMVNRLVRIVNFFALVSLLAGGFLLFSAMLATRMARMREGVYYRVLGATSGFVVRVFSLENLLFALLCGGCGLLVAQGAAWGICHFVLQVQHHLYPGTSLATLGVSALLMVAVGICATVPVLYKKPATFLREE